MDDAKAEVLVFTAFRRVHWRKLWSTSPLPTEQQRGQAQVPLSRDTPQRRRRHPPRRSRPDRHSRRMNCWRPPLAVRRHHGQAPRTPRQRPHGGDRKLRVSTGGSTSEPTARRALDRAVSGPRPPFLGIRHCGVAELVQLTRHTAWSSLGARNPAHRPVVLVARVLSLPANPERAPRHATSMGTMHGRPARVRNRLDISRKRRCVAGRTPCVCSRGHRTDDPVVASAIRSELSARHSHGGMPRWQLQAVNALTYQGATWIGE